MQYNPDELNEILNIYNVESEEILQEFNDVFFEFEKNPTDKTPLKKLFQLAHSLKGASRMIGFNSIQDIFHKLEDVLSYWKKDDSSIDTENFHIIYEVCDFVGVLIEKCVQQKTNVYDDKVTYFLSILDNIINSNKIAIIEEKSDIKDSAVLKNLDINAIILELMFVIENQDFQNDFDDICLVLVDNLKQLQEIFINTEHDEIKKQIDTLLLSLSNDSNKPDFNKIKNDVLELRKNINILYKKLHLNFKNIQVTKSEQIEEPKKEDSQESINEENNIIENFDYILSSLQKIKYDKNFIKEVTDRLENIISTENDKRISLILNKTINILNLFIEKGINIDNDCYMVILQCIYLAKRIALKEKEENLNNLNFLIQRLSVVEDMFNIDDIHMENQIELKQETSILSSENFSNIKKNLKSLELQEIKTLRVDTKKLDNLISQTGELIVNGMKTREHIVELSKINSKLIAWNGVSKKIINYLKYLEKKGFFNSGMNDSAIAFFKRTQEFFSSNADVISEINSDFANLYNIISEDDNKLHQTAIEIESIAKGIRVLPLATIFHSFPRMIRDIAKENNKKVDFIVSGSDTTVDKKILEEIKMPLIHILRNAVSHGIESTEDRIKIGKSETGTIKLTARQAENNVIISIEDDGYGINVQKVKELALQRGLLTQEEIVSLSDEQIIKLIFLPGFSTEDSVTEISGRGIGLDIVKTKISNLNGDINIDSIVGKGSKVTIKLPLSMSTIKTFVMLINNQKYAIPVSSVKFVKNITSEDIFKQNGQYCIIHNEHSVPLYSFAEILGEEQANISDKIYTVIIIENQEKQAAFIVDKLLGDQEVFQKKLVPPILKIKNISGFTTLSTGEICLIINPFELIRNTISDIYLTNSVIKQIATNSNQEIN